MDRHANEQPEPGSIAPWPADPHPQPFLDPGPDWVTVLDMDGITLASGLATVARTVTHDAVDDVDVITYTVHYVDVQGAPGGGVLPVRAESDEKPHTQPVPHPLGDWTPAAWESERIANADLTVVVDAIVDTLTPLDTRHYPHPGDPGDANSDPGATPLDALTVTHAHWHTHADPHSRDEPAHTHFHPHTGAEALSRAHTYGHGDDLHQHAHPDAGAGPTPDPAA